jgi:thioredoxin-dependent peroxiredoxin
MSYPTLGSPAPAFTLPVTGGNYPEGATVSSKDLEGQSYVLYFYPKDDTPGCTTQACALRDGWAGLSGKAALFGVSTDPLKSHQKFIAKYSLPFPLLSDEAKTLTEAYGVWVEKSMYGKTYLGTERTTFIIGADAKLKAILPKVKPAAHLDQLLAALK